MTFNPLTDLPLYLTPDEGEALRTVSNNIAPGEDPVQFTRDAANYARANGSSEVAPIYDSLADKLEALRTTLKALGKVH